YRARLPSVSSSSFHDLPGKLLFLVPTQPESSRCQNHSPVLAANDHYFAPDRSDQCHTHADSLPGYWLRCIRRQPDVCLVITLLEKAAHEFSATSSYHLKSPTHPPHF